MLDVVSGSASTCTVPLVISSYQQGRPHDCQLSLRRCRIDGRAEHDPLHDVDVDRLPRTSASLLSLCDYLYWRPLLMLVDHLAVSLSLTFSTLAVFRRSSRSVPSTLFPRYPLLLSLIAHRSSRSESFPRFSQSPPLLSLVAFCSSLSPCPLLLSLYTLRFHRSSRHFLPHRVHRSSSRSESTAALAQSPLLLSLAHCHQLFSLRTH